MKYVMAYSGRRDPALLEEGVHRDTLSAECRAAALELMSGVAKGWEKIDLARWLTGPYARATRHCQAGERIIREGHGPLASSTIEELMTSTRTRVLAALEKAALSDGSLDFTKDVVDRGFVRRAWDTDGMEAWVPVDASRMRLIDRVRSLFVADYLNDPVSYGALYVCHRCENIVFDEAARRLGICGRHRISGIVARNDDDDNDNVYIGDLVMLPPPFAAKAK